MGAYIALYDEIVVFSGTLNTTKAVCLMKIANDIKIVMENSFYHQNLDMLRGNPTSIRRLQWFIKMRLVIIMVYISTLS